MTPVACFNRECVLFLEARLRVFSPSEWFFNAYPCFGRRKLRQDIRYISDNSRSPRGSQGASGKVFILSASPQWCRMQKCPTIHQSTTRSRACHDVVLWRLVQYVTQDRDLPHPLSPPAASLSTVKGTCKSESFSGICACSCTRHRK